MFSSVSAHKPGTLRAWHRRAIHLHSIHRLRSRLLHRLCPRVGVLPCLLRRRSANSHRLSLRFAHLPHFTLPPLIGTRVFRPHRAYIGSVFALVVSSPSVLDAQHQAAACPMNLYDGRPANVGTRVVAVADGSDPNRYCRGDKGVIIGLNDNDPVVLWDRSGVDCQSNKLNLRTDVDRNRQRDIRDGRTLVVLVRGEMFRTGAQGTRRRDGDVAEQVAASASLYHHLLQPLADSVAAGGSGFDRVRVLVEAVHDPDQRSLDLVWEAFAEARADLRLWDERFEQPAHNRRDHAFRFQPKNARIQLLGWIRSLQLVRDALPEVGEDPAVLLVRADLHFKQPLPDLTNARWLAQSDAFVGLWRLDPEIIRPFLIADGVTFDPGNQPWWLNDTMLFSPTLSALHDRVLLPHATTYRYRHVHFLPDWIREARGQLRNLVDDRYYDADSAKEWNPYYRMIGRTERPQGSGHSSRDAPQPPRTLVVLVRGEMFRRGGQGTRGGDGDIQEQLDASESLYHRVLQPLALSAQRQGSGFTRVRLLVDVKYDDEWRSPHDIDRSFRLALNDDLLWAPDRGSRESLPVESRQYHTENAPTQLRSLVRSLEFVRDALPGEDPAVLILRADFHWKERSLPHLTNARWLADVADDQVVAPWLLGLHLISDATQPAHSPSLWASDVILFAPKTALLLERVLRPHVETAPRHLHPLPNWIRDAGLRLELFLPGYVNDVNTATRWNPFYKITGRREMPPETEEFPNSSTEPDRLVGRVIALWSPGFRRFIRMGDGINHGSHATFLDRSVL